MAYFILRNGQQYGPYSPADIERYLTVGGIVVTDLARTDEMNQWLPLAQIICNTPPPPTAAEDLDAKRVSPSDQRRASGGPGLGEGNLKMRPMPPPDHVPACSAPRESRAHRFSNRIRHFLRRLWFGLNGSHRPVQ